MNQTRTIFERGYRKTSSLAPYLNILNCLHQPNLSAGISKAITHPYNLESVIKYHESRSTRLTRNRFAMVAFLASIASLVLIGTGATAVGTKVLRELCLPAGDTVVGPRLEGAP